MAENAVQSVQGLIQDVLAPDVRELKVRMEALEKRMDQLERRIDRLEKHIDERFAAAAEQSEIHLQLVLSAIERSSLMSQNRELHAVADLRERVAVLEARTA